MDTNLVNDLIDFGFTDYEARVFLVLSIKGPLTASEIGKCTEIPNSKVYEIVNKLESKSILEVSKEGKYKKYKVLDASHIIKKMVEKRKSNVKVLEKKAEHILKKINTGNSKPTESIWICQGKKNFLEKVSVMAKNSNDYAYAITKEFSRIPDLDQEIINAAKRGVEVKIIGNIDKFNELNLARARWYASHNVKIRTIPLEIQPRICLVDGKEVCLRVDNGYDSEFIWSNNPALINLIKSYFEVLWKSAEPFKN
jgi:sugar-specific transcriptional regulator TrmB